MSHHHVELCEQCGKPCQTAEPHACPTEPRVEAVAELVSHPYQFAAPFAWILVKNGKPNGIPIAHRPGDWQEIERVWGATFTPLYPHVGTVPTHWVRNFVAEILEAGRVGQTNRQNGAFKSERDWVECTELCIEEWVKFYFKDFALTASRGSGVAAVVSEDAKDAARYRFWRDKACNQPSIIARNLTSCLYTHEIDETIDKLMRAALTASRGGWVMPKYRHVTDAVLEYALWMWLLLCAYGQRDSWRDNNWWYFGMSSIMGAFAVQLLRDHIKLPTPTPASDDDQ